MPPSDTLIITMTLRNYALDLKAFPLLFLVGKVPLSESRCSSVLAAVLRQGHGTHNVGNPIFAWEEKIIWNSPWDEPFPLDVTLFMPKTVVDFMCAPHL